MSKTEATIDYPDGVLGQFHHIYESKVALERLKNHQQYGDATRQMLLDAVVKAVFATKQPSETLDALEALIAVAKDWSAAIEARTE